MAERMDPVKNISKLFITTKVTSTSSTF